MTFLYSGYFDLAWNKHRYCVTKNTEDVSGSFSCASQYNIRAIALMHLNGMNSLIFILCLISEQHVPLYSALAQT